MPSPPTQRVQTPQPIRSRDGGRLRAAYLLPLVLLACAPPDVGPLVGEVGAAFDSSAKAGRPALVAAAARETRAAEDARIAQRAEVLDLSEGCDQRTIDAAAPDCRLVNFATVDDSRLTATEMLLFEDVMAGYVTAIAALADPDGSAAVPLALDRLVAAEGALRLQIGEDATGGLGRQASRLRAAASTLTDRARARALRRIIPDADAPIQAIALQIASWHDSRPGGLNDLLRALQTQRDLVERRRRSGSQAAHRRAIDKLKTDFAAYEKAYADSPGHLLRVAAARHRDLVDAVQGRASPEDILDAAERLKAIITAPDAT